MKYINNITKNMNPEVSTSPKVEAKKTEVAPAVSTEVASPETTAPVAPVATVPASEAIVASDEEKRISSISYLPGMAMLALAEKNSSYCQFHGKQALGTNLLFFLVVAVAPVLSLIVMGSFIGVIILNLLAIIAIGSVIFVGYTAGKAGKQIKIPVVSSIANQLV